MSLGETNPWSKDVQRLLWAAGEARARASRREHHQRPGARRQVTEPPAAGAGAGFFTEWQPVAH